MSHHQTLQFHRPLRRTTMAPPVFRNITRGLPMPGTTVPTESVPARMRKDQRNALVASFLGWTLDAFDFFIVVMVLTEIAKDFGRSNADMAFTLTVTLAFRPIGAFIFGLLADRYGRRTPLMIDVVFYSVIEI